MRVDSLVLAANKTICMCLGLRFSIQPMWSSNWHLGEIQSARNSDMFEQDFPCQWFSGGTYLIGPLRRTPTPKILSPFFELSKAMPVAPSFIAAVLTTSMEHNRKICWKFIVADFCCIERKWNPSLAQRPVVSCRFRDGESIRSDRLLREMTRWWCGTARFLFGFFLNTFQNPVDTSFTRKYEQLFVLQRHHEKAFSVWIPY